MCDHCGENSGIGQVLLKCDRCEFRSHGGCTFPPVKAKLTTWFCNDCVHRGATRPSCCLQCGGAGANASCSTCRGQFHKKCIRSSRCSPCRRSGKQTIRTWRMVLLDRRKHVSAKAYNSWVLVLEGKVGDKLIRTKEIVGVVPPRLLRTLDNCTVTLQGAPCIAWPPTPFDLDQLDSFREGFPEDWVTRIRPTNGDAQNRARRGALPQPWPPAVASNVEANGCDVLPKNSVVLRRFITGWKQGRVKKTIMIDSVAKVLVHYIENKYGDVLSLHDINDLTARKMMWVFKADEDGWTDPEVETLSCAVKSGLRWDEVAEKVAAVAPGANVVQTEEWCRQKTHKLRIKPAGPKAAEQLKERLKQDALTMEKPLVDMFSSNVVGPTVDTHTLRTLESDCPDIDEPNKENICDIKSDVESGSDDVFASPQATARSRFVFQHVNHRRPRSGALRLPGPKVLRRAPRSEHEALAASLSNLLRREETDEETDDENDIDKTPLNSIFL